MITTVGLVNIDHLIQIQEKEKKKNSKDLFDFSL